MSLQNNSQKVPNFKIFLSIILEQFQPEQVPGLNSDFETASTKGEFALAIFPQIETEQDLSQLIETLGKSEGWTLNEFHRRDNHKMIELLWQNPLGKLSNAVGFAPTLSMPVSRRAPFVALGLWPGGHDNPFLRRHGENVGLADTQHHLTEEQYTRQHKNTQTKVKGLIGHRFSTDLLRRLTFRIPNETRFQERQS